MVIFGLFCRFCRKLTKKEDRFLGVHPPALIRGFEHFLECFEHCFLLYFSVRVFNATLCWEWLFKGIFEKMMKSGMGFRGLARGI